MEGEARVLAEEKGVGQVVLCGACEDVHLSVGGVTLRVGRQDFLRLAGMLRAAASRLDHPADGSGTGRYALRFVDGRPRFRVVRAAKGRGTEGGR